MISKLGEVIAKGTLYIVVSIFAAIYNFFRITFLFLAPILKKALTYIIVIVFIMFIIYKIL